MEALAALGPCQLQVGREMAMKGWDCDARHPSSQQGWPHQPKVLIQQPDLVLE